MWGSFCVKLSERRKFWLEHRDPLKEFFCPHPNVVEQIFEKLLKNSPAHVSLFYHACSFISYLIRKQWLDYSDSEKTASRMLAYGNYIFYGYKILINSIIFITWFIISYLRESFSCNIMFLIVSSIALRQLSLSLSLNNLFFFRAILYPIAKIFILRFVTFCFSFFHFTHVYLSISFLQIVIQHFIPMFILSRWQIHMK